MRNLPRVSSKAAARTLVAGLAVVAASLVAVFAQDASTPTTTPKVDSRVITEPPPGLQPRIDTAIEGPPAAPAADATMPVGPAGTEPASLPASSQASTASMPASTQASMPTSMPTSFPTSGPKANGGPLSLNFKDASLRSVLEYLSEMAGLIVIEEAKVDGRVTVISRQPVTVEEATNLLDTVLRQKGYAAIRQDRTIRIVTLDQAKKDMIPVRTGNDPEKIKPSDRMITQIIPIRYADAIKLKTDLAALVPTGTDVTTNAASNTLIITGTEATVRHIIEIIKAIDVQMSEVTQVKVFALKYANATNAARLITEIFNQDQTGRGGMGFGQFGRGGFVIGMPGGNQGTTETGQRPTKVSASADDRTNTLVVSAAPDVLKAIENVVKELDSNPAETQAVFIYRLRNAKAKNVEGVLNNIFGTGSGTGYSSSSGQRTQTFGSSGSAFGSSGSGGAFGRGNSSSGGRGLSSGGLASSSGGRTTGGSSYGGSSYRGGSSGRTGFGTAGRTGTGVATPGGGDLYGQVYVVADEDTNSIAVTTASANFERVRGIIEDLDRAVPQVLIKVLVAEVTHDNSVDLGMELSGMNLYGTQVVDGLRLGNQVPIDQTVNSNGSITKVIPRAIEGRGFNSGSNFGVAAAQNGFTFRLDEKYVQAAIHALANNSKLDVLSRPYILTGDNQEAQILIGQEFPFITRSQVTADGNTLNTIEYDSIGIKLDVIPHINPQGLVTLDAYTEISALTGATVPVSDTVSAPVFAKRAAQNRVSVIDGQTIVIGGLMEDRNTDTVDKVPLLGDLPGIGAMFRRTQTRKIKTELIIFMTPHVAEQPELLQGMSKDERNGIKLIPNSVEKGAFEEQLRGMARGAASRPAFKDDRPRIEYLPVPPNSPQQQSPDGTPPAGDTSGGQPDPAGPANVPDAPPPLPREPAPGE